MKNNSILSTIQSCTPANSDEAINAVAEQLIASVKDGNESAAKTVAKIRFLQLVFDRVEDAILEDVLHELQHAPEKEGIQLFGFRVKRRMTAGRFNFSACQHPEYNRLIEELAPLNERKKEIEDILKKLKTTMTVVDEATGEACSVFPPTKDSERLTIEVARK